MRPFAVLVASTLMVGAGTFTALADPDFVAAVGVGPLQLTTSLGTQADGPAVQALLSGAFDFTPTLGAQGDLLVRLETLEFSATEVAISSLHLTAHGFYREPEKFLFGGIVQLGADDFDTSTIDNRTDYAAFGVEGQVFFDQLTIYGQLGLQRQIHRNPEFTGDGWLATGEARYFLTPDLKVEAHGGFSRVTDDNGDFDIANIGLGAEYKLSELPFSVFGKYDFARHSSSLSSIDRDSQRVLLGLKFSMGEGTLLDRDRNGASLKPIDFGTAYSIFGI